MKPKPTVVNVGNLFGKQPPAASDAERALIGSAMLEPRVVDDVAQIMRAEMFHGERHREIWAAIVALYESTSAVDLVQLVEAIRGRGTLDQIGGTPYLMELAEAVPSSAGAVYYARQVSDAYTLRQLIEACSLGIHDAYHGNDGTTEAVRRIVDMAEQRIFKIAEVRESAEPSDLASMVQAEITRASSDEDADGIPTGFYYLDQMLGGLRAGELIILAARPSVGKTALAMNIAENVAASGVAVGVLSMEMGRNAITQRLLASRAGVDFTRLRSKRLNDQDFEAIMRAANELAALSIIVDDTPGLTVNQCRSMARRMVTKHKIGCLFIDYLQLMSAPGSARESRQAEVSEISRGVKALARELNIPVVCLSQLNRASESRSEHRPRMSDLRESGSIEQDADVVLLLHREEYFHRDDPSWAVEYPDKVGQAEIIVAKQRNGPCDTVFVRFDGPTMRFSDKNESHGGFI